MSVKGQEVQEDGLKSGAALAAKYQKVQADYTAQVNAAAAHYGLTQAEKQQMALNLINNLQAQGTMTPGQAAAQLQQQRVANLQGMAAISWNTSGFGGDIPAYVQKVLQDRLGQDFTYATKETVNQAVYELLRRMDNTLPRHTDLGYGQPAHQPTSKKMTDETAECECGSAAIKHPVHADFCPMGEILAKKEAELKAEYARRAEERNKKLSEELKQQEERLKKIQEMFTKASSYFSDPLATPAINEEIKKRDDLLGARMIKPFRKKAK